ncbi:MAG: hypothetical protein AUK54_03110 [Helicobacteraceae bacterium CG2_30_36_10]|nr:MAG: hypothetical protein AUK54_03110 [Helicobacteraceae bacterium CG2_30_36_10]
MKNVSLLFGVHMHQPVDNFGDAVDEAIKLCYKPFFETMVKYPDFKFCVHCSGWLLDKIRVEHPDIFENMKSLTKTGAIEWVGAGYYEPVLSSIPSRDRRAQIDKMSNYLKKHFNIKPKGLWLTERVWESALVPDLVACGIEYAVVDDYHFLSSGYDAAKMDGYYTTEEGAQELTLFPIAQSLRYALPFYSVKRAVNAILECSKHENSTAIIFDDAEKFGLWPQTNVWVYEQKWLEGFVEAILENDRIVCEHYTSYMKKNRSLGIAYLNNTSYFEMGEWSLKSRQTLALEKLKQSVGDDYFNNLGVAFIKGGIWKNFFIKYHESNYLHKRMLYFSVNQECLNKSSLESLYKLQTNDVFWHGVFGGLYLPNLRDNAYKYLLEIEKSKSKNEIFFEVLDIDKDGYDELKVLTKNLSLVFSTKYAGQMVEFGSFDTLFNWQNTLMRREEAYHQKILNPKEVNSELNYIQEEVDEIATIHNEALVLDETLKSELIYDWHPKNSFIDHFSDKEFTLENFQALSFHEVGDFANQPFELNKNKFVRDGGIFLDNAYMTYPTTLTKEYSFTNNSINLNMKANSEYKERLFFAQEFNFHFAHPYIVTFNSKTLKDGFREHDCDKLVIMDDFTNKYLIIKVNQKCNIFAFVLNTISQSESGFDRVAQGISFIFTRAFESELKLKFSLELTDV